MLLSPAIRFNNEILVIIAAREPFMCDYKLYSLPNGDPLNARIYMIGIEMQFHAF